MNPMFNMHQYQNDKKFKQPFLKPNKYVENLPKLNTMSYEAKYMMTNSESFGQ